MARVRFFHVPTYADHPCGHTSLRTHPAAQYLHSHQRVSDGIRLSEGAVCAVFDFRRMWV